MSFVLRNIALCIALVVVVGCKLVDEQPKGRSPLAPVASSPDQVTLEVFSAPAPLDDPRWQALWSEIDEQSLSPQLRTRLAQRHASRDDRRAHARCAGLAAKGHGRAHLGRRSHQSAVGRQAWRRDALDATESRQAAGADTHQRARSALAVAQPGRRSGRENLSEGRRTTGNARVSGVRRRGAAGACARAASRRTENTNHSLRRQVHLDHAARQGSLLRIEDRGNITPGEVLLLTSLDGCPSSIGHHLFVRTDSEAPLRTLWALRIAKAGGDRSFADWETQPSKTAAIAGSD